MNLYKVKFFCCWFVSICTIFTLGTTSHGMPNKNDIIKILEQVLIDNYVSLHGIFQESIGAISNELLQAGIITPGVQRSPSYNVIISQFVGGMNFINTQKELEEHCKVFITALTNVGGPLRRAAQMVKKEWIDTVKQELLVELQLN